MKPINKIGALSHSEKQSILEMIGRFLQMPTAEVEFSKPQYDRNSHSHYAYEILLHHNKKTNSFFKMQIIPPFVHHHGLHNYNEGIAFRLTYNNFGGSFNGKSIGNFHGHSALLELLILDLEQTQCAIEAFPQNDIAERHIKLLKEDMFQAFSTYLGATSPPGTYNNRLQYASHFISYNSNDPSLQVSSIAEYANIHPDTLRKKFKKTTGISTKQAIIQSRLTAAAFMILENEKTLKDIAIASGFARYNRFADTIRKKFNISASEFAAKIRSKELAISDIEGNNTNLFQN